MAKPWALLLVMVMVVGAAIGRTQAAEGARPGVVEVAHPGAAHAARCSRP